MNPRTKRASTNFLFVRSNPNWYNVVCVNFKRKGEGERKLVFVLTLYHTHLRIPTPPPHNATENTLINGNLGMSY